MRTYKMSGPADMLDFILLFGVAPVAHPLITCLVIAQWFVRRSRRFAALSYDVLTWMRFSHETTLAITATLLPAARDMLNRYQVQYQWDDVPRPMIHQDDFDVAVKSQANPGDPKKNIREGDLIGMLMRLKHILVIGHTQGGKTSLIHELCQRLVDKYKVIVCDPDAAPGLWDGCHVFGAGEQVQELAQGLKWAQFIFDARKEQRAKGKRTFEPVYVVVDEAQVVVEKIDWAIGVIEDIARRGAKVGVFLIVGVQDAQVKTLNLERKSQVLINFTTVRIQYHGQVRYAKITECDAGPTYDMVIPQLPEIKNLIKEYEVDDIDEDELFIKVQEELTPLEAQAQRGKVEEFISAKLRTVAGASIKSNEVYAAYCMWAASQSFVPLNRTAFGLELKRLDVRKDKVGGYILYFDLELVREQKHEYVTINERSDITGYSRMVHSPVGNSDSEANSWIN